MTDDIITRISNRWFLTDQLLFMTLMSHEVRPNPKLRHPIRSGQGRIEYNLDCRPAKLSEAELEELLRAEVIRILLRHPYRHHGNKAAAYMASNIILNENYKFEYLTYKAHEIWGNGNFYKNRNFEFYYNELVKGKMGEEGEEEEEGEGSGGGDRSEDLSGDSKNKGGRSKGEGDENDDGRSGSKGGGRDGRSEGDERSGRDGSEGDERSGRDGSEGDEGSGSNGESRRDRSSHDGESGQEDGSGRSGDKGNSSEEDDYKGDKQSNGSQRRRKAVEGSALWDVDDFMDEKIRQVLEWAHANMQWGSLAGKLVDELIATLTPKIDYRKIISSFRASVLASNKNLTRFRPSRRFGFLYMGKKSDFTTNLLLAVDVSGSISDKYVQVFYSIINRFFKYGIQSIDVIQFDTEIKLPLLTLRKAKKTVKVYGRGGTSFQPVIDYFEDATRKRYDGLIIFTDGEAPIPKMKPQTIRKTLWICDDNYSYKRHEKWMRKHGRCSWVEDFFG